MQPLEIHTQAENGHVSFDLPAGYDELENARLVVVVLAESATDAAALVSLDTLPQFPPTDWAALEKALAEVVALNPYRTITDPVQWQQKLREEWERPLPGRP